MKNIYFFLNIVKYSQSRQSRNEKQQGETQTSSRQFTSFLCVIYQKSACVPYWK